MTRLKDFAVAAVVLVMTVLVAGCGGDAGGEVHTAGNGDKFNDADVAFATDMIPHHAQALTMVDMTMGRDLSPELTTLAEEIRMAQTPEIEQMVDWLRAWDRPVPETARDHANAHSDDGTDMHSEMPGMMSAEDMSALEDATGREFETMWLEMMIEHHQGAVEMAQKEQDAGVFKPALKLAESIESAQQAEIKKMQQLLDS